MNFDLLWFICFAMALCPLKMCWIEAGIDRVIQNDMIEIAFIKYHPMECAILTLSHISFEIRKSDERQLDVFFFFFYFIPRWFCVWISKKKKCENSNSFGSALYSAHSVAQHVFHFMCFFCCLDLKKNKINSERQRKPKINRILTDIQ